MYFFNSLGVARNFMQITNIRCDGDEDYLWDCSFNNSINLNCDFYNQVAIHCGMLTLYFANSVIQLTHRQVLIHR